MRQYKIERVCPYLLLICPLVTSAVAVGQSTSEPVSRAAAVSWLRHQAQLVRTAECDYEMRRLPTKVEMIPLIRELFRLHKDETAYRRNVWDDALCRATSYVARWRRKGAKEIREKWGLDQDRLGPAAETVAFDGQVVRTVDHDQDGRPIGVIQNQRQAHFSNAERLEPFSLIYEYIDKPYYEIVASGTHFHASRILSQSGQGGIRMAVTHPDNPNLSFVLLFDKHHRLLERKHITEMKPWDSGPREYDRWVFSEYQAFQDASGETIWFPLKAVDTAYIGKLPDGRLVVPFERVVTIRNIKFNVDIPDSTFDLEIPSGIPTFDELSGQGWINLNGGPVSRFLRHATDWHVLAWVGPLLLLVLVYVTVKVRRRYKAKHA